MTKDIYFTVATAGHVDHGKTSVLKRLTGINPDRLKEEQERQMTTDLGFAYMDLPSNIFDQEDKNQNKYWLGFIDVPGHGKFLKNMLAGVGAIDMALLVVAADEGVMPQTRQHVEILSLLHVKNILVILTKLDLVGDEKSLLQLPNIEMLLEEHNLTMLDAVPVSCMNGQGFDRLRKALADSVYKLTPRSQSVLDQLPTFLPIDRVFSKSGHGLVVTGTLVRGQINEGDNLSIEPPGVVGRVRGLESFGKKIQTAHSGQRLAVNLSLKGSAKLVRGNCLLEQPTSASTVLIVSVETYTAHDAIKPQKVKLYHATAECVGYLGFCEKVDDQHNTSISFGDVLIGQINLKDKLIAEPQERYILRYGDAGIAGGAILATIRPRWLTRAKLNQFSNYLLQENYSDAVCWYVKENPRIITPVSELASFLPLMARERCVDTLVECKLLERIDDGLIAEEIKEKLINEVLDKLQVLLKKEREKDENQFAGLPIEHVRATHFPRIDRALFALILKELIESGTLKKSADKVTLPQMPVASNKSTVATEIIEQVQRELAQHVCIEIDELCRLSKLNAKSFAQVIGHLEKQQKCKRIAHGFVCSSAALQQAHSVLAELAKEKQTISPSDFKERLQITRKYAMALLSYFDDTLITRRLPTGRVLLRVSSMTKD